MQRTDHGFRQPISYSKARTDAGRGLFSLCKPVQGAKTSCFRINRPRLNFFFHWIAPVASSATKWHDVLPMSMPITATSFMTVLLNEDGQYASDRVAP